MAITFNNNFKIGIGAPIDSKYLNSLNQPYASTGATNSAIQQSQRYVGLTVNVGYVEYWYKNGTADTDLILKTFSGGTGGGTITGATNGLGVSGKNICLGGAATGWCMTLSPNSYQKVCYDSVTPTSSVFDTVLSNVANTCYSELYMRPGDIYQFSQGTNGNASSDVCPNCIEFLTHTGSTNTTFSMNNGKILITSSSVGFGGVKYGGNYRANFICNSLVDAAYVTGKTAALGSVITGATNGLGVTGKMICLGGALTKNTAITGAFTVSFTGGTKLNTTCGYQISGTTMFRTTPNNITNIAIGQQALNANSIHGAENIAIGCRALYNDTCGFSNIAIGDGTLYYNYCGQGNIGIGQSSLTCNTDGCFNIALGGALFKNTTGSNNIALGRAALYNNTIGCDNIALGTYTLCKNSGYYNIALGTQALWRNTIGCHNVIIGDQAGTNNITGSSSVFIGTNAGQNETGSNKLHIANCATKSLIYGEFDNEILKINGKLYVCGLTNASKSNVVYYDSATKELTYDTVKNNNIYSKTIINISTGLTTGSTYVILVNPVSATTITLPAVPIDGQVFKIKDISGNAIVNNIIIDAGFGILIDNAQTATINTDYGAFELMYEIATSTWYSMAFIN